MFECKHVNILEKNTWSNTCLNNTRVFMNSGRKRLGNTNGSRDHSDVSKPNPKNPEDIFQRPISQKKPNREAPRRNPYSQKKPRNPEDIFLRPSQKPPKTEGTKRCVDCCTLCRCMQRSCGIGVVVELGVGKHRTFVDHSLFVGHPLLRCDAVAMRHAMRMLGNTFETRLCDNVIFCSAANWLLGSTYRL